MAPPLKRRRLFSWPSEEMSEEEQTSEHSVHHKHGFSHTVTQIETTPVQSLTPVEEVHIQIQHQIAAHGQHDQGLIARQAVSLDTAATLSLSVALPTDSTSSTVASTTSLNPAVSSNVSTSTDSVSSTASISASSSTSISSVPSISSVTALSSPAITSSPLAFSTTTASNITVAANVLTTGLNGTFFGAASRTGSVTSSFYSNSSYTFSLSSSSTTSDSTSYSTTESTSDAPGATSVYLTTATISRDGQAASTITTSVGAAGYGTPATPTSSASVSSGTNDSSAPPPPGTIAGGVVGGAAGLAVLLLVAMLFLRWYRKRSQAAHQALLPGSSGTYHDSEPPMSRDGPGMAERAGIRPWAAAFPGIMRHQVPSDSSRSLVAAVPHERSFQRISGRKLPSAWSPGMDGPPPPMPGAAADRASGASSFYPDSATNVNPFADSPEGGTPEDGSTLGRQRSDERMTVVPGPQRRPTIHNPNRHLAVDTQQKHMSSVARTSGTASTLLHTESSNSNGSTQSRQHV